MTGYTRADTVNNIADGNIINASDLDGEFDALQSAFNNSTGHVHDGSAANGAPITKLGPSQDVVASASAFTPKTTATVDIGSTSLKFKDFFFSGAGTIGGGLTVTGSITQGGVATPTISSTSTLTNKWVQPRVLASTANSATPTLNTDSYDMMVITGQTLAITSFTTNLTGTPVNGQKLIIAITGTAAVAITWGASFESSTATLPSTTVTTARLDIGFIWNAATSKWRCVASA